MIEKQMDEASYEFSLVDVDDRKAAYIDLFKIFGTILLKRMRSEILSTYI